MKSIHTKTFISVLFIIISLVCAGIGCVRFVKYCEDSAWNKYNELGDKLYKERGFMRSKLSEDDDTQFEGDDYISRYLRESANTATYHPPAGHTSDYPELKQHEPNLLVILLSGILLVFVPVFILSMLLLHLLLRGCIFVFRL